MKKIAILNNSNNELVQNLISKMLKKNIEACLFDQLSDIIGQDLDLIVLYDSNNITADGDIAKTFDDNITDRFTSMNWNVINIHPSLLPAFEGENAITNAFVSGVKISGITIHEPSGRIIAQYPVIISNLMHLDEFEKKMHSAELKFVPKVIESIIENKAFDYEDLFNNKSEHNNCGGCGHCGRSCKHNK